jgi:hypothetical protein
MNVKTVKFNLVGEVRNSLHCRRLRESDGQYYFQYKGNIILLSNEAMQQFKDIK